jgi:hypothetical protein
VVRERPDPRDADVVLRQRLGKFTPFLGNQRQTAETRVSRMVSASRLAARTRDATGAAEAIASMERRSMAGFLWSDFDSYLLKMGLKAALCRWKTWI